MLIAELPPRQEGTKAGVLPAWDCGKALAWEST